MHLSLDAGVVKHFNQQKDQMARREKREREGKKEPRRWNSLFQIEDER